jgi:GNAT superfamily N-acetyltransferase
MNLYEQYVKERENLDVIKTDRGFIHYRIEFPNCVINDCFVLKEFRQDGHATFLVNQVFEICKQAGIKSVFCQVDDQAKGHMVSAKALENFGFEFIKKENHLSFYKMEVSEWENHSAIQ